jgi:G:T-mismatch repair DNA endonuclease (very short patch repair protein)
MLTTRHPVDFAYTRPELDALFRYAHAHDVEQGGHYDARSAAVNVWSHHWAHPATRDASDIIGTFYVRWDTLTLWEIETEEGFSLEDLMQALGRWELAALGRVKHGDVPEHP